MFTEANLTVSVAEKKIDTIVGSDYSKLLNNYLKSCDRKFVYLNTKIEKIEAKKSFACALPMLAISSFVFFLAVGAINPSILLLISALILSASLALKMLQNCTKQLQNFDLQLYTLKKIKEYFESEKKLSNEYNNALINFSILEREKFHDNKLSLILGNGENIDYLQRDYLSNLISQYSNDYQKNLSIIDKLKRLDDKKRKEYLDSIYNKTNNNFIKMDMNTNKKLLIDNHKQIKLAINSQYISSILSSNEITLANKNNTQPNSNIKPISLRKEDYNFPYYKKDGIIYIDSDPMPPLFQDENRERFQEMDAINTPNELNSIFTYQQGEDILPPKVQEELKKEHQLSKKLPNFPK
ncbi:MAG: hypothetical protein HFI86_03835 [Bacilli bacterium]|nr:hypothetical protein [Bacilli bacterium]